MDGKIATRMKEWETGGKKQLLRNGQTDEQIFRTQMPLSAHGADSGTVDREMGHKRMLTGTLSQPLVTPLTNERNRSQGVFCGGQRGHLPAWALPSGLWFWGLITKSKVHLPCWGQLDLATRWRLLPQDHLITMILCGRLLGSGARIWPDDPRWFGGLWWE